MPDYSPTQPVAYIMDDKYLPAAVRPLAQTWRALDERAENVEMKLAQARGGHNAAVHADTLAATEAVKAGKPVPVPHDNLERANQATIRSAEIESRLVLLEKVRAGELLLASLLEHRDELATSVTARVAKAMGTYTLALDAAEATLSAAAAELSHATEGLGTLFDLSAEPRHRCEVAAMEHDISTPDFGKTRMQLTLLDIDLLQIANPSNRIAVRVLDGRVIDFPFESGVHAIRELGATYVAPEDVPADAMHAGN